MSIEEKIKAMGLEIPEVPKPVAAYLPGVVSGKYIFTAGQLPVENGQLIYKGKLGADFSAEEGYKAAQICLLNCLGVVKSLVGDLDKIKRIVKINGFVNCVPDFTEQPQVINGASELCVKILDQAGQHARAAVGSISLPLGAAVEVEMIVELKE